MLRKFCYGLAALATTATAVVAQPANDLCENATVLGSYLSFQQTTPFDTTGATNTPADVNPLGCLSAADAVFKDVWFSYTPVITGRVYIQVSDESLHVSVYSACGGAGNVLVCAVGSTNWQATAGQTGYIRVSGDSDTPFTGNIKIYPPDPSGVNDLCANATPLQYDTPVAYLTENSTNTLNDVNPSCLSAANNARNDIWYSYTPNVTGTFPVIVVPGGTGTFAPKIIAVTACGGTGQLLACLDGGNITPPLPSLAILDVPGTAGETVYIRLGGSNNFTRYGSIQIGTSLPPDNDWCRNFSGGADLFAGSPEAFDTAYATIHYADPFYTCLTPVQAAANDVWYHYQVDGSVPQGYVYSVAVTSSSPGFVPNISMYGSCGSNGGPVPPQACVSGNVGDSTNGFGARVVVKVYNDGNDTTNTYNTNIRIGGDDNTPGNGVIQVDGPVPALPNDDCANAAAIADGQTISFSNAFATNSSFGSTCPGSDVTADNNFDAWYVFTPNQNGQVTFSTCGSTSPVRLSTYNDACDTQVDCGTTETCSVANGSFGTITVPATSGTPIRLRVAAFHGHVGDIQLHAQFGVGCAADFNHVNGVTVQDIFDFLTAWLAGSPTADFNHVNGVTVQDIFDFLTAWLAGC